MSSREQEQPKEYRKHLKIGGMVAIAMGVTNMFDLNNTVQGDLAKEMEKPSIQDVSNAKQILSEASDDFWDTEDRSIFKKDAIREATRIINQKDAFFAEAWNRIGRDNQPIIIFDLGLIAGGVLLRNKIKKIEKEEA